MGFQSIIKEWMSVCCLLLRMILFLVAVNGKGHLSPWLYPGFQQRKRTDQRTETDKPLRCKSQAFGRQRCCLHCNQLCGWFFFNFFFAALLKNHKRGSTWYKTDRKLHVPEHLLFSHSFPFRCSFEIPLMHPPTVHLWIFAHYVGAVGGTGIHLLMNACRVKWGGEFQKVFHADI